LSAFSNLAEDLNRISHRIKGAISIKLARMSHNIYGNYKVLYGAVSFVT
jgi:hypothetical protein